MDDVLLHYDELKEGKIYWTKMLEDGKWVYVQDATVINGEIYGANQMTLVFKKYTGAIDFLRELRFIEMPEGIAEVRLKNDGATYYQHNIYK